jgi:hypothetical protein
MPLQQDGTDLSSPAKPLSPVKRIAGLVALLVVIVVSGAFGLWMRRVRDGGPPSAPVVIPNLLGSLALVVLGLTLMTLGGALYGVVLATRCFTFRFDQPFMTTFPWKLWVLNLAVGLLLQSGFSIVCAPGLVQALAGALPPVVLLPVAFFGPFLLAQFVLIWLQLFAPLEKSLISRRLVALGCAPESHLGGIFIGTSDASRSSFKRFPIVEQDMGMLWISPQRLVYRGDRQWFDLTPQQVTAIERRADAGSSSSYFGAVHVILHVASTNGAPPQRLRLHPEGQWTMTSKTRALNDLAERLSAWKIAPAPAGIEARQ